MKTELKNILKTVLDKVYYNHALECTHSPYCVYTMTRHEDEYVLDGITGIRYMLFDINVYCKDLTQLESIANQIRLKLLDLLGKIQGGFYIQKVSVVMNDFYDYMVDMNRTAIEFEIYFKEA